jgi:NADH dehydrogenase
MGRVLSPYPADLSAKAENSLADLGVTVRTDTRVTDIQDGMVMVQYNGQTEKN